MKEKNLIPITNERGRDGGRRGPYNLTTRLVDKWITHLHNLAKKPKCNECKDSGLTVSQDYYKWDYCKCKKGNE